MLKKILILGAGTAGLLAALTLRRRCPELKIEVVRSPNIGVIGVGESTTAGFPRYLVSELGLSPAQIYAEVQPTWKLGIRFLWGPRQEFSYSFSRQFNHRQRDLPRANGFYCEQAVTNVDLWSALMQHDRALPRRPDGAPDFDEHRHLAFHVENKKLVAFLEGQARKVDVSFVDGTVREVERHADGAVAALHLECGQRVDADFFVDASGFRSELLGRALSEPFDSYSDSLRCDRAVVGGWNRTNETIKPYTTAETMNAGWCWQIDHEHYIDRGYVYSSRHLSDEEAAAELRAKNPRIQNEPRIVRFRAGRYRRAWVHNVVAVGNACGFVEPLEATAIAAITEQCRTLAQCLHESFLDPTPGMRDLHNRFAADNWDEIRDFIALHYKFNVRLDTPFWRMCQEEIKLHTAQPLVDFYQENGPTAFHTPVVLRPLSPFGMEGYLALLVGQKVPYAKTHAPSAKELTVWNRSCIENAARARAGLTVKEGIEVVRKVSGS